MRGLRTLLERVQDYLNQDVEGIDPEDDPESILEDLPEDEDSEEMSDLLLRVKSYLEERSEGKDYANTTEDVEHLLDDVDAELEKLDMEDESASEDSDEDEDDLDEEEDEDEIPEG